MSTSPERVRRSTRTRRKEGTTTHVRTRKRRASPSSAWEDEPVETQEVSISQILMEKDVPVVHPVVHVGLAVAVGGILFWWYRPAFGPLLRGATRQLPSPDTLLAVWGETSSTLGWLNATLCTLLVQLSRVITTGAQHVWWASGQWAREASTRLAGVAAYLPACLGAWVWYAVVLGCKIGVQIAFAFLAVVWLVYVAEIVLPMVLHR